MLNNSLKDAAVKLKCQLASVLLQTPRFLHCGWSGQVPRPVVMSLMGAVCGVSLAGFQPGPLLRAPGSEGQVCLGGCSVVASH